VLYVSLVLSMIVLLVANYFACRPGRPVAGLLVCGLVFIGLPMYLGIFFPPVVIQFFLMCAALLSWRTGSSNRRSFLVLSLSATAAAYGVAVCLSLPEELEFAHLRERFPYESMEERLPMPHSPNKEKRLPPDADVRLARLENSVQKSQGTYNLMQPAFLLRRLHEEKVELFVNSPGFGVARIFGRPSESGITRKLRPNAPVPQPASPAYPSGSGADPSPSPRVSESEGLHRMHEEAIVDFACPAGFGYVKDRRHVAGYQAHQFSGVPRREERWEVRRLELVGLLLHNEPVVYVSENLPRMDELRGAPTRPLDGFEATALEKLRSGKDLLVAEAPSGVRMLGAIRSVKQCGTCHGSKRGTLLGAFSYTLR
jgi:hypothetical protein